MSATPDFLKSNERDNGQRPLLRGVVELVCEGPEESCPWELRSVSFPTFSGCLKGTPQLGSIWFAPLMKLGIGKTVFLWPSLPATETQERELL